jgi:hypothetical protein
MSVEKSPVFESILALKSVFIVTAVPLLFCGLFYAIRRYEAPHQKRPAMLYVELDQNFFGNFLEGSANPSS